MIPGADLAVSSLIPALVLCVGALGKGTISAALYCFVLEMCCACNAGKVEEGLNASCSMYNCKGFPVTR